MKNITPTDPPNSGPRARLIMTNLVGGVKDGVQSRIVYVHMHHDMAVLLSRLIASTRIIGCLSLDRDWNYDRA